jgi:hypothetical protein
VFSRKGILCHETLECHYPFSEVPILLIHFPPPSCRPAIAYPALLLSLPLISETAGLGKTWSACPGDPIAFQARSYRQGELPLSTVEPAIAHTFQWKAQGMRYDSNLPQENGYQVTM